MTAPDVEPEPTGLGTTYRAAVQAGAPFGLLFGVADGLAALVRLGERGPQGPFEVAGCLGAAGLWYGLAGTALAVLLGTALHPLLVRRSREERVGLLLTLVATAGIFLALYWWTRPWIYPGLPSTSPPRLAAAAGLGLVALALGALVARLARVLPAGVKLGVALALPLAWMVGVFFLFFEGRHVRERGEIDDANHDLPNVLLIVVDALRADVLEPYGSQEVRTPALAGLARDGVVFENAFAQAPFTWTSFGSILTGKYPLRHGLISMKPGVRMVPSVTLPFHLKHAKRIDGRQLTPNSWASAAFLTGTLSNDSGLMRGFDGYSEMMDGHDFVELDSPWSVFRSELTAFLVRSKLGQRVDAGRVVSNAVRWLREHEDRRWVAMVHLYSTHTPYDPHSPWREMYVDPEYQGPIQAFYADHRLAIERGDYALSPEDEARIADLYHGGTSQADARIGQLVSELDALGVREDTLVIVTSDHGEELGDHGLWEHNWMYQTNLRIPLLLSWPGGLEGGKRVDALVESVDLLPTVCDLLGLVPPAQETDRDRVDGLSLLPLIRGETPSVRERSFALNPSFASVHDLEWKLIAPLSYLQGEPWDAAVERMRLFHLAEDPGELRDLLPTDDPEVLARAKELGEALRAWREAQPITPTDVATTSRDVDDLEILRMLGYVDASGEEVGVEIRLEDAPAGAPGSPEDE